MVIFLPIALILAAILLILLLPRIRPSFSSEWLISFTALWLSAVALILLRARMPITHTLSGWESIPFLPASPLLLLDTTSSAFALGVLFIIISCFLLSVNQSPAVRKDVVLTFWLVISAMFSLLSGNLLTTAIAWMVFDLLTFAFHILPQHEDRPHIHANVLKLSLWSTAVLVFAVTLSTIEIPGKIDVPSLAFTNTVLVFSAVFLRLGAGLHDQGHEQVSAKKLYRNALQPFLNSSMALIVATRAASAGLATQHGAGFAISALLVSLLLVLKSLRKQKRAMHLRYWFMLGAALILLSTSQSQENASLVWGITILFIGWFSLHAKPKRRVSTFDSIAFSAALVFSVPFSLNIAFANSDWLDSVVELGYLFFQAMLLIDFLKKVLSTSKSPPEVDRFGPANAAAFLILPAAFFAITYFFIAPLPTPPGNLLLWSPVYVFSVALIGLVIGRFGLRIPNIVVSLFDSIFSPQWLSRWVSRVIGAVHTVINTITLLLEGEGGVLWALLLVALLVSLITQMPGGN